MARLDDKIFNLLEYTGIRSKSYSHTFSRCIYDPADPLSYYLDQSQRANYTGPVDSQGIPYMILAVGWNIFRFLLAFIRLVIWNCTVKANVMRT